MAGVTFTRMPAAPPAWPADIRATHVLAAFVAVLALAVLAAAALAALLRASWLPVRGLVLEGEMARSSVAAVRAVVMPRLAGNLLSLDLQRARGAFEAVPWVRRAVVRRVWPDRLAVRLEEHRAVALWETENGVERLLNSHGEVFEANVGDVEGEALPVVGGPDGSASRVHGLLLRLRAVLAPLGRDVRRMHLSARGSWSVELDNGVGLELGRGSEQEVMARVERFLRTVPQVVRHYGAPLLHADLRHPEGYAVRLRGMTTKPADAGAARSN